MSGIIRNPDTLVAISCYGGDIFRITNALDLGLLSNHQCPICLLCPADAPAHLWDRSDVVTRAYGKRGTQGPEHLARWDGYFRMLLEFPQKYFVILDSDSYCLTAEFPRRFYEEPDTFWSFHHPEGRPHASPYPKIAMQSPLWLSRSSIEKLMSVDRAKVGCHPVTPYQDWYLVALTCECGNLTYKHNPDAVSFPGWNGGGVNAVVDSFSSGPEYRGGDRMVQEVLNGKILLHSVRHRDMLERVVAARLEYEQQHPEAPKMRPEG